MPENEAKTKIKRPQSEKEVMCMSKHK